MTVFSESPRGALNTLRVFVLKPNLYLSKVETAFLVFVGTDILFLNKLLVAVRLKLLREFYVSGFDDAAV